ncbi:MAG: hypothetical protein AABZ44_10190, partial [Elusimicrobiota bacterium]
AKLLKAFGPQGWWPLKCKYHPGRYPRLKKQEAFEIGIGAILTQNTAWTNVERAIKALHAAHAFEPTHLLALPQNKLMVLIRPTGYFKQKAKKLRIFAEYVESLPGHDLRALKRSSLEQNRKDLLGLWGIGRETADSILLYALDMEIFVVDAYARRISGRLGILQHSDGDYDVIRKYFEKGIPASSVTFQEYHALIVELAKRHCLKSSPRCNTCPLLSDCGFGNAKSLT